MEKNTENEHKIPFHIVFEISDLVRDMQQVTGGRAMGYSLGVSPDFSQKYGLDAGACFAFDVPIMVKLDRKLDCKKTHKLTMVYPNNGDPIRMDKYLDKFELLPERDL